MGALTPDQRAVISRHFTCKIGWILQMMNNNLLWEILRKECLSSKVISEYWMAIQDYVLCLHYWMSSMFWMSGQESYSSYIEICISYCVIIASFCLPYLAEKNNIKSQPHANASSVHLQNIKYIFTTTVQFSEEIFIMCKNHWLLNSSLFFLQCALAQYSEHSRAFHCVFTSSPWFVA